MNYLKPSNAEAMLSLKINGVVISTKVPIETKITNESNELEILSIKQKDRRKEIDNVELLKIKINAEIKEIILEKQKKWKGKMYCYDHPLPEYVIAIYKYPQRKILDTFIVTKRNK